MLCRATAENRKRGKSAPRDHVTIFSLFRRARQVNRSRQSKKIELENARVAKGDQRELGEKRAEQIKAAKVLNKENHQKQNKAKTQNTNQTTLPALCTGSITRPNSLSSEAPRQHSDQSHRSFSHHQHAKGYRPSGVLKLMPGPANDQLQNRHRSQAFFIPSAFHNKPRSKPETLPVSRPTGLSRYFR